MGNVHQSLLLDCRVRFASGATTVFELKVTEVMKPMRAFCGLEEDDEYTQMRWLTSAHACGGKKSPVNDIAVIQEPR